MSQNQNETWLFETLEFRNLVDELVETISTVQATADRRGELLRRARTVLCVHGGRRETTCSLCALVDAIIAELAGEGDGRG